MVIYEINTASFRAHPENRFPNIDNVEDKNYYNRLAFAHVKHVIRII